MFRILISDVRQLRGNRLVSQNSNTSKTPLTLHSLGGGHCAACFTWIKDVVANTASLGGPLLWLLYKEKTETQKSLDSGRTPVGWSIGVRDSLSDEEDRQVKAEERAMCCLEELSGQGNTHWRGLRRGCPWC